MSCQQIKHIANVLGDHSCHLLSHAGVQARHFFKAGESRSQGKVMILCLAQQLLAQLTGLAGLLLPVVETHGSGASLSMQEVFEKWVLTPILHVSSLSQV
mgnify:CR=1 FL=1